MPIFNNPADPKNPNAKGTLMGKIIDNTTSQGISGATVTTIPATTTATTSASGNYTISNIGVGTYTVTASKSGYSTNSTSATVTAGATSTANISLSTIIEWIAVPGGTFQMGDNFNEGDPDEKPVHSVTLNDFKISKYEITFDQYDIFCDSTGRSKPSDNGWGRGRLPVINVSWYDAKAFCDWLSTQTGKTIRLPTEAEWEYAARGRGEIIKYSGTNSSSELGNYAWYYSNSGSKTHPVGEKLPNSLGIYDISGNVWEWCIDWYDANYYSVSPQNNPKGPLSGTYRVLRGGSWYSSDYNCRGSNRNVNDPTYANYYVGFRCVEE